jgi:hypothetical protein
VILSLFLFGDLLVAGFSAWNSYSWTLSTFLMKSFTIYSLRLSCFRAWLRLLIVIPNVWLHQVFWRNQDPYSVVPYLWRYRVVDLLNWRQIVYLDWLIVWIDVWVIRYHFSYWWYHCAFWSVWPWIWVIHVDFRTTFWISCNNIDYKWRDRKRMIRRQRKIRFVRMKSIIRFVLTLTIWRHITMRWQNNLVVVDMV